MHTGRIISGFMVLLFLISCSSENQSLHNDTAEESFSVILITDVGGRGDKGFNDAGWEGCEDAKRRLAEQGAEISIRAIESREQTDYVDNLNLASERADVVVALGFLIAESVEQVAPHYPDTSYIFIDGRIQGDNIASFEFKSQEGAFLAGILAGFVTKTNIIGVMPGMDIPPVEAFAAGYRAGGRTAGALQEVDITILKSTIGSFSDPVKAKSIAQTLISQGADVLFQLAGVSGLGVIEAVKEASDQRFAIGVDINQDDLAPGKVLTSVLKRMDKAVSDQIVAAYEGKFEAGIYDVGLKDGYVELTDMVHTRHLVPDKAFTVLDQARKAIISGSIAVPSTFAAEETFELPVEEFQVQ